MASEDIAVIAVTTVTTATTAIGPTGPTGFGETGPTGPASTGAQIIAVAHVAIDGTLLANTGFSSSALVLLDYQLTLASPPSDDSKVVPVAMLEGPGNNFGFLQAIVVGGVIHVRNRTDFPVSGSDGPTPFFIIVSVGG